MEIEAGLGVEAFYIQGRRTGALVRQVRPGLLLTTVAFLPPDGFPVHLWQETRFGATVLDWNSYRYRDSTAGVDVQRTSSAAEGAHPPAVPSYAAHLVLAQALRTGAGRLAFGQFTEDGDGTVLASAFVRHGREIIDTPEGRREAQKVVLEVEGEPRSSFWSSGEVVVKSDWQGATSYAVRDPAFVLDGLAPRVQSILAEALALPDGR